MEEKPDKKKESIDEILSDLNGLLNKMPSILDGIKMPEMQPMELPKAAQPEPEKDTLPEAAPLQDASPAEPAADAGDKTVVLPPFAGLEEGAPAPETPQTAPETPQTAPETAQPAPDAPASFDAEKTVVLEAFSGLPEGSAAPAPEKLEPQSLGDFMFGENAGDQQPASAPELPAAPEPAAASEAALPSIPEPGPDSMVFGQGAEAPVPAASLPAFDNTKDFGIPDIDALMQMSDSGQAAPEPAAEPLPEAGVMPEAVQSIEESKDAVSIQGLEEAAPVPAASPEGLVNFEEPKEEPAAAQRPEAALEGLVNFDEPEEKSEPAQAPEAAPASEPSPFDAFAIEASSAEAAPAAGDVPAVEALQPEPALEMPAPQAAEAAGPEPAAEPLQGAETLKFETTAEAAAQAPQFGALPDFGQPGAEAAPAEPAAEGIGIAPGIELGGQPLAAEAAPGIELSAGEPQAEAADQTMPGAGGLELSVGQPQAGADAPSLPGGAGLELSVGQPKNDAADQTMPGGSGLELGGGSGDATLVMPPPSGDAGDGDKTAIFQAAPSTTSRAQAGDLTDLAAKQPPEGIPAERIRTLMFLYASEDKALCATVLAELDAICLKSSVKPMFVKRAAVKECDPDANPNFILQSVTEAGAQGLVCLGSVPQDKIYELENTFSSSGGFFRYYDSSTFSHSSALDLVTDLILR